MSDLQAALLALGATATEVCAVSSVPPPTGIEGLARALNRRRAGIDLASRRRARAPAPCARELRGRHGERGLRALGGRAQAARWLDRQDPTLDAATLERALADWATRDLDG